MSQDKRNSENILTFAKQNDNHYELDSSINCST